MKKKCFFCLLIMLNMLLTCFALSEGFLPDLDEVYGIEVPSFMNIIQRKPYSIEDTEQGKKELYSGVKDSDYNAYGVLLKEAGCETESYTVIDDVIQIIISCRNKSFVFTYDRKNHTASVVFPEGIIGINNTPIEGVSGSIDDSETEQPIKYEHIMFGSYPQQKDGQDRTPVEWIVLTREGNKALLVSLYGLEAKPFHDSNAFTTWENSSIRKWLNQDFLNKAFTAEEQSAILLTTVDNGKSQGYVGYNSDGGQQNTKDHIFLLSYYEAFEQYLTSDSTRICYLTDYAIAQGAFADRKNMIEGRASGRWWLRSPGSSRDRAAFVGSSGFCDSSNLFINSSSVRPALWLNLDAEIFESGIPFVFKGI